MSNRTAITRKDIAVEGEIQRIFYNNEYLGLVVRDEAKTGYQLHIYTSEGNENAVTEQDELHTGYAFQQRNIVRCGLLRGSIIFRKNTFCERVWK